METLTLPGKLDSLKQIRDFVGRVAEKVGMDRRSTYRLNLAVDEIATNIIMHGYEEAGLEGEVVVKAEFDDRALTIRLEDSGVPYDPSERGQESLIKLPLDERPEGGWGVFLASQNVDELTYEHVTGRNLHTLVVELNQKSS